MLGHFVDQSLIVILVRHGSLFFGLTPRQVGISIAGDCRSQAVSQEDVQA
jgi:hypothetical protein